MHPTPTMPSTKRIVKTLIKFQQVILSGRESANPQSEHNNSAAFLGSLNELIRKSNLSRRAIWATQNPNKDLHESPHETATKVSGDERPQAAPLLLLLISDIRRNMGEKVGRKGRLMTVADEGA